MTQERRQNGDNGLLLDEAAPKLKRPPQYKVVLLNDDYTPMEFVVEILELFFDMSRAKATQIMLHVHTRGKGLCRRVHLPDRGDQGGTSQCLFT